MNKQFNTEEQTDLGTFLGRIAYQLNKEGNSLQALAMMWFEDEGEEKRKILGQSGIDLSIWGEKLLAIRDRLCQECKLQSVSIIISFSSDNKFTDKKETGSQ